MKHIQSKCKKCGAIVYKGADGLLYDFVKHNFLLGCAEYEHHNCKKG